MRYRTFGRLGWQVSEIGFGTWGMGGWSGSDDAASIAALERGLALGCNFLDTALAYGDGRSERLIGQVLSAKPTPPPIIASKIPPKNGRWPALPSYPVDEAYPADHIRASTEVSLKHLGVDRIDLQQFHVWTDEWARDAGWQKAVTRLKDEGLIGGVGISINRWEPANVIRALKTGLIDAVQVVYNIFDQAPEDELFPLCQELGVAVIARVPFDEGSLTGTLTRESTWPRGDWRNVYFTQKHLEATLARVDRLRPLVPAGMDLPELALRFILQHPAVSTVIPGMRTTRHVERNLAPSGGLPLSPDLLAALRAHRWDRSTVTR
jgi:aryl-alcohol dehydrogenase-like predicted oxidoreductase